MRVRSAAHALGALALASAARAAPRAMQGAGVIQEGDMFNPGKLVIDVQDKFECTNLWDQLYGPNTCKNLISTGKKTCAGDFAAGKNFANQCDKSCSYRYCAPCQAMTVTAGKPAEVGNLLDLVTKKRGSCAVLLEYSDTDDTDCAQKFCPHCGKYAHYCDLSCGYCVAAASWVAVEEKLETCFADLHAGVLDVEDTCLKPDPSDPLGNVVPDCSNGNTECGSSLAMLNHAQDVGCATVDIHAYTKELNNILLPLKNLTATGNCHVDTWNICDSMPCGTGTCSADSDTTYTCACPPDYNGENCQMLSGFDHPIVNCADSLKENAPVITEHCCTNADRDGNGYPDDCNQGVPSACTKNCAGIWLPFASQCSIWLKNQKQYAALSAFTAKCEATAYGVVESGVKGRSAGRCNDIEFESFVGSVERSCCRGHVGTGPRCNFEGALETLVFPKKCTPACAKKFDPFFSECKVKWSGATLTKWHNFLFKCQPHNVDGSMGPGVH